MMSRPALLFDLWGALQEPSGKRWDRRIARWVDRRKPKLSRRIETRLQSAALHSPELASHLPQPLECHEALLRALRRTVHLLRLSSPKKVTLEGGELLRTALDSGRPVICCGIHQGAWELLPLALQQQGFRVDVPVASQRYFSRSITALRSKTGAHYYPAQESLFRIRSRVEKKKKSKERDNPAVIALLIDQPGPAQSAKEKKVLLFGEERCWWSAPLELAHRLGGTLLPFSQEWRESLVEGENQWEAVVKIHPPLLEEGVAIAQRSAEWAERQIIARPAEWVWFYSNTSDDG